MTATGARPLSVIGVVVTARDGDETYFEYGSITKALRTTGAEGSSARASVVGAPPAIGIVKSESIVASTIRSPAIAG